APADHRGRDEIAVARIVDRIDQQALCSCIIGHPGVRFPTISCRHDEEDPVQIDSPVFPKTDLDRFEEAQGLDPWRDAWGDHCDLGVSFEQGVNLALSDYPAADHQAAPASQIQRDGEVGRHETLLTGAIRSSDSWLVSGPR